MDYDILFLDASDAVIRRRYKETQPPAPDGPKRPAAPLTRPSAASGEILQPLRERARYIIDNVAVFGGAEPRAHLQPVPQQRPVRHVRSTSSRSASSTACRRRRTSCSTCAACRNPFYVPELKELTGLDQPVVDYVMQSARLAGAAAPVREHARILAAALCQGGQKPACRGGWAARAASTARSPLPASWANSVKGSATSPSSCTATPNARCKGSVRLQRGQQPRTAAPNASISPFGIPFDKILQQIARSEQSSSHTICRKISLSVSPSSAHVRRRRRI